MNTQRLASLSKVTIGSPSLVASHWPPKPLQSVLPSAGPNTSCPVALLKMPKDKLTHWM
jgi:hypothetical protein